MRCYLVPLGPELLHQSVHPLLVEGEGLGGVGEVAAVDHVLQHLDPVVVLVQQQHPAASNLLRLHHRLQVGQETHVLAHVGGQHHVYHHLPDGHPLLAREPREDVAGRVLQQFEGHGQVVVLQYGLVVVHKGQLVGRVDEVLVGQAGVVDVVDGAGQDGGHDLQGGEALGQGVAGQKEVSGLGHVRRVQVVVVGDGLEHRLWALGLAQ